MHMQMLGEMLLDQRWCVTALIFLAGFESGKYFARHKAKTVEFDTHLEDAKVQFEFLCEMLKEFV